MDRVFFDSHVILALPEILQEPVQLPAIFQSSGHLSGGSNLGLILGAADSPAEFSIRQNQSHLFLSFNSPLKNPHWAGLGWCKPSQGANHVAKVCGEFKSLKD
jgi:hypothetical protein